MPAPPPWLSSKPPSSTSQASYCEPKSPIIKVEPGTEGSPEAMTMSSNAKTKTRSESHSGTPLLDEKDQENVRRLTFAQEKEVVASETWQYINGLTPVPIPIPLFPSAMRAVLQLPRQRDLPEAWKLRLASEKLSYTNLALLINYLNGDAPKDILCNSSAASCAEKWRSVVPAITSLEEGKGTIYKDGAFPRCVFFPIVKEEHQASSKRICCNAFYRDSDSPSTPGIWSPPNPTHIPGLFLASSSSFSSSFIKEEPRIEEAPIAQHTPKNKSSKREERSDSPSDSGPRKKQKQEVVKKPNYEELQKRLQASETWQYINRFTTWEYTTPSEYGVKSFERPRKRNLPIAWKRRIAVEKPNIKIRRLLVGYLTGDEELNYLCSLPGANCSEKSETIGPAIKSMQQGKLVIYKEGAFPRCVLFETSSGKKKCCNAVYRDAGSDFMPLVWWPPTSVPAPASSAVEPQAPSAVVASLSPAASSSEYSPEPPIAVERALPENLIPEIPSHQPHHEAQPQQETGYLADLWEQRNDAMYLSGPINVSTSYAHSAGWLHQREGQVLPIGTDGATLQILDLENKGATVLLPSDSQNLLCIVFEGTVEIILQDTPVFTLSRGGQWSVGVGKECRVRNPRIGTKAVLYNIGAPVKQNDE